MKIEIDTDKIVKEIDIKKLVEKGITSEIEVSPKIDDIVDNILEKEEMKNFIEKRTIEIIEEYLSSDEGKESIIEQLESSIDEYNIMSDDRVVELIIEFLKKNLMSK